MSRRADGHQDEYWLGDPQVSLLRPATRGIWYDAICAMRQLDESGVLTGSLSELARICRCTSNEMRMAITDLKLRNAAEISEGDESITLIDRRMRRKCMDRQLTAQRVRRHRERQKGCNGCNTTLSRPSNGHVTIADPEHKKGKEKELGEMLSGCNAQETAMKREGVTDPPPSPGSSLSLSPGTPISIPPPPPPTPLGYAGAPPKSRRERRAAANARIAVEGGDSDYRRFTDHWVDAFARKYSGTVYQFDKAEGAHVSRIWAKACKELRTAVAIANEYLADKTPYYEGHPLKKLAQDFNKFQTRVMRKNGASHARNNDNAGSGSRAAGDQRLAAGIEIEDAPADS